MATEKQLSELEPAAELRDDDLLLVQQDGVARRITGAEALAKVVDGWDMSGLDSFYLTARGKPIIGPIGPFSTGNGSIARLQPLTINGQIYDGSEVVSVDTTPLVITVTGNETDGYTADKTKDELRQAYNNNRQMVCNIDGGATKIPLVLVSGTILARVYHFQGFVAKSYTRVTLNELSNGPVKVGVSMDNIGEISTLTINSTSYNGTKDVTINTSPLYINITQDETTGEWAADQKYAMIRYYMSLGRTPICVIDGLYLPLVGAEGELVFHTTLGLGDMFVAYYVTIGEDDSVSVEMAETLGLPNPNPLIINGQSYSGESEVTVDTGEFVVTVTGTQADGYTADKTYAEARAAYDAGRTVVCLFNGEMFVDFRVPLSMVNNAYMAFTTSPMSGVYVAIDLSAELTIASEMLMEMTIGDQTWQMDQSVDFTDTINGMIDAKLAAITNAEEVAF